MKLNSERLKRDDLKEEGRKANVKVMEMRAEFTVRMNEVLNIKEERDNNVKLAQLAEKKLKDTKKVML